MSFGERRSQLASAMQPRSVADVCASGVFVFAPIAPRSAAARRIRRGWWQVSPGELDTRESNGLKESAK